MSSYFTYRLQIYVLVFIGLCAQSCFSQITPLTAIKHLYFVEKVQPDPNSGVLFQQIGAFSAWNGEKVYFRKFATAGINSTFYLSVLDPNTLMYYGIQRTPLGNAVSNLLYGFRVNVSGSDNQASQCDLPTKIKVTPIVSFNRITYSQEGIAYILIVTGTTAFLYEIGLFAPGTPSSSPCNVSEPTLYELDGIIENFDPYSVLGSAIDWEGNKFWFLYKTVGLISLDLNSSGSIAMYPLNSTFQLVSLSMNPDNITRDLFISASVNGAPSLVRFIQNGTYYSVIGKVAFTGDLGYDYINQIFIIQSDTSLSLYNQYLQSQANFSLANSWVTMTYFPREPPYCPNGCTQNGDCIDNTCHCYFGWSFPDCSSCDSNVFCYNHGICSVQHKNNRTCQCTNGWKPPQCNECDSQYFCGGHGVCSASENGLCQCTEGWYGPSCSSCNSTLLCSGHGNCSINGTCTCHFPWSGDKCDAFEIPNATIHSTIFLMNLITVGLWLLLFVIAIFALLFSEFSIGKAAGRIVTPISIKATITYFQSFVLLISTNQVSFLFHSLFWYFHYFTGDVITAHQLDDNIWMDSSLFLPKVALFLITLITWKLIKNTQYRGKLLQVGLWGYFFFIVSLFQRFQSCNSCSTAYNVVSVIISLIIITIIVYFFYRLWRVIFNNRQYFENDSDYETNIYIEAQPPGWYSVASSILTVVCHPPSQILSTFFLRMCSAPTQADTFGAPPITPNTDWKMSKYSPESSVEEFLDHIIKKLGKDDLDISRIVAMLKGNWFTTVADLRNLTESDAEKLNIPLMLYHAIQEELPKKADTKDAYVRIDTLVKTKQKDKFLTSYGRLAEDVKTSCLLFRLDELLVRNFLWALLFISLWDLPHYQFALVLIIQVWYTLFIIWSRPFHRKIDLIEVAIPEAILVIVIILMIVVYIKQDLYNLLLAFPILNMIALLGSFLPHHFITMHKRLYPKDQEKTPLLRKRVSEFSANSDTRPPATHFS